MDINKNNTATYQLTKVVNGDHRDNYRMLDNMEKMIGQDSNQSKTTTDTQTIQLDKMKNLNLQMEERPILNGEVTLSPDSSTEVKETKTESLKNKITWQDLSPKGERRVRRQNSSGSIKSSSSGSGSSECSSCSPPGSPTKSWKTIRESNKNNSISWKDLSPTKAAKKNDILNSRDDNSPTSPTKVNDNEIGKCTICSPERCSSEKENKTVFGPDNACDQIQNQTNSKVCNKTLCNHTTCVTENCRNHACNCHSINSNNVTNQNEINKLQGSPEHTCKQLSNQRELCRNNTSEEMNNEYFYDEDFSVQFDSNLRESSTGLNCTCIDPSIVSDFPHIVTGSYLSFGNMKGSVLDQNINTELFCPDESELSSCRNSAMDMSSSEREMMCSSDMLEFSDNPLFTPSPTKELDRQNNSTDSLDKDDKCQGQTGCCQGNSLELSTSRTSSEGNLCVNCCPKKEEYFLSFDGSQGKSNSENDNSLTSITSAPGHWGQNSSGEEMVSEECTDSFHFCYMTNGNSNIQHGHRRIKFHSLKAVQENANENEACEEENKSDEKDTKMAIIDNTKFLGHKGKNGCCHGQKAHSNKSSSPSKQSLRQTLPHRKVTSWKQVKSLKRLGKLDSMLEPGKSNSMPELYVQTWQSFSSQDCLDLAKIAESFHSKRHSAYLLDLYQRVRNQSNPVSPETMANIEQILFHPLITQNRCHGEQNLHIPVNPCVICGRDGSHSSHTLTNSNVQHLVNTSRSGQQLDHYTRKRIIEWLEKDKLDTKSKGTSCQTDKETKTAETVISPTTVTLWCGTKNFGSQFPPCTKDCGIQVSENEDDGKWASVEQQTSVTLETEYKRRNSIEVGQQTSPKSEKNDILSMLPETFKDLEDILPRPNIEEKKSVPRSKSADCNVLKRKKDVVNQETVSYYSYKSLPDLNFLEGRPDLIHERDISLFDPLPVSMPIPVLIPAFGKSFSGHPTPKISEPKSIPSKTRSKSAPAKLAHPHLFRNVTECESGSSSSGFSTSSTSSGIDAGYSNEDRSYTAASPSNDIERLLFYPPHVESSTKLQKDCANQISSKGQTGTKAGITSKPKKKPERNVTKYANEMHPISLENKRKVKSSTSCVSGEENLSKKSASDHNLQTEHLYSLQEENTPISSPDQSKCPHTCCHGDVCFLSNTHIQISSESGSSSSGSMNPKHSKKPLKSCLRKQHFLKSRSLSDPHNLAQPTESQKQKKKQHRHSYACEEVYLLTDDSGQYYLCQSDNSSNTNDSTGPVLFYLEGNETDNAQPVKLRRKKVDENAGNDGGDTLSGKRKSVSFASEVSFHAISPQASPKHGTDNVIDVESIEDETNDEEAREEEPEPEECDAPPQDFKLSPPEENVYSHRFDEIERKRVILTEVCHVSEMIVNHFSAAKNPFDKLRLGSSADVPEIGDLILNRLCPAVNQVVEDGLKPFLNGVQMFGRLNITVWKVAEISAEQGPYTRAIHDLVQQLKQNAGLHSSAAKFEAFVFGLLNLRLLDYWMGYLRYSDSITDRFYNPEGVIILGRSCHERAYDEMLISLQPLSILPFQLGVEFILENSKNLSRSPSPNPITNRPSPGLSPTSERSKIPPPKPARSLSVGASTGPPRSLSTGASTGPPRSLSTGASTGPPKSPSTGASTGPPKSLSTGASTGPPKSLSSGASTGLISTKAWEWLKRGSSDITSPADSPKNNSMISSITEMVGKWTGVNTSENGVNQKVTVEACEEKKNQVEGRKQSVKEEKGMTDSFSGIAQKLLGMNSSKDKVIDKDTPKPVNEIKEVIKKDDTDASSQNPTESVSTKAKSGILKFFDKLLLSKDSDSQMPKKRYSWNNSSDNQKSPVSPASKSLSPVSGTKELKNSIVYQKQRLNNNAKKLTKPKVENVVAKSIQKEAKMEQDKVPGKNGKTPQKDSPKFENSENTKEEKGAANIRKEKSSMLSLRLKSEVKPGSSDGSEGETLLSSPQKKVPDKLKSNGNSGKNLVSPVTGSPKRRLGDKARGSRIPTLQKKADSGKTHRYSLVLDSPGSSSQGTISSPTRVRHSVSAGQIPTAIPSPKRSKPVSVCQEETLTEKASTMKIQDTKYRINDGNISSTEFPSISPSVSVDSSSCASLELGPTLIAPPNNKLSNPNAAQIAKNTADKSQNKSATNSGTQILELDINSNSRLPSSSSNECVTAAAAQNSDCGPPAPSSGECGTDTTDKAECKAKKENQIEKQKEKKDFQKPDFRYIQTLVDFQSSEVSQLSYNKGDHFEVLAEIDSSWFYCVSGAQEGLIHVDAVKPLMDQDEFKMLHNSFYS